VLTKTGWVVTIVFVSAVGVTVDILGGGVTKCFTHEFDLVFGLVFVVVGEVACCAWDGVVDVWATVDSCF
jgi:hypothetical protein